VTSSNSDQGVRTRAFAVSCLLLPFFPPSSFFPLALYFTLTCGFAAVAAVGTVTGVVVEAGATLDCVRVRHLCCPSSLYLSPAARFLPPPSLPPSALMIFGFRWRQWHAWGYHFSSCVATYTCVQVVVEALSLACSMFHVRR
jgi:hypothetical protein